jgi:hypothetical protein
MSISSGSVPPARFCPSRFDLLEPVSNALIGLLFSANATNHAQNHGQDTSSQSLNDKAYESLRSTILNESVDRIVIDIFRLGETPKIVSAERNAYYERCKSIINAWGSKFFVKQILTWSVSHKTTGHNVESKLNNRLILEIRESGIREALLELLINKDNAFNLDTFEPQLIPNSNSTTLGSSQPFPNAIVKRDRSSALDDKSSSKRLKQ